MRRGKKREGLIENDQKKGRKEGRKEGKRRKERERERERERAEKWPCGLYLIKINAFLRPPFPPRPLMEGRKEDCDTFFLATSLVVTRVSCVHFMRDTLLAETRKKVACRKLPLSLFVPFGGFCVLGWFSRALPT